MGSVSVENAVVDGHAYPTGLALGGTVEVPLTERFTLPIWAKVAFDAVPLSPYLMVGPSLVLVVSERGYSSETEVTRSNGELVRDFDAAAEIEAVAEVPLNVRAGTALSLGARYPLGVADFGAVREGGGGDTRDGRSVRSRGLLVRAGFLIQL